MRKVTHLVIIQWSSYLDNKIWTTSWLVWKTKCLLNRKKRHSNKHTLRNTQECNMRSKIRWFTEVCNSHYVSHFAAFFIVTRAKISIVKSCFLFLVKVINNELLSCFVVNGWMLMFDVNHPSIMLICNHTLSSRKCVYNIIFLWYTIAIINITII